MKIVRTLNGAGSIASGSLQPDGSVREIEGDLFGDFQETARRAGAHRVLAPVAPAAILCIGLNYRKHAEETHAAIPKFPVVFMKAAGALLDPEEPILLPRWLASARVDYEGELAVVIGRKCKNVPRSEALNYVLGYTCANDVSARDWQKDGGGTQWCRGKSFDTFAPLGPCLVTADEIPNPSALQIRTTVNADVLQDCCTADMIFDVPSLIEFLSGSTTLHPGTVILTGTPHGVGMGRTPQRFLRAGDVVTVEIEGIGRLTNRVEEELAAGRSSFQIGDP